MANQSAGPEPVRPLGWGRFILQLVTVVVAYVAFSVPAILAWKLLGWGSLSTAGAISTLMSAIGALFVAWLWLRSDRAASIAFNLSRPASWPRTILIGLAGTATIIIIFNTVGPLLHYLGAPEPNVTLVLDLVNKSPATFAMWVLLVAWGSAGFGEELLFRGFLLDRLMRLPGLRDRIVPIILLQALIFGSAHSYQGWSGMVVTGCVGIFLGWLRIRLKGNLWALVIAHGMTDTLMLSLGYAQAMGWKIPGLTS